jgi:hypothetical protein
MSPRPEKLTVPVVPPAVLAGWDWADAATAVWLGEAADAGLPVELMSAQVPYPGTQVAIVSVAAERFVLEVGCSGNGHAVRALHMER